MLDSRLAPCECGLLFVAKAYGQTLARAMGVKFVYMLSGRVKYRYGSRTMEVKPGDSLLFDARALHGAEILRERPISYLSLVFTLRE